MGGDVVSDGANEFLNRAEASASDALVCKIAEPSSSRKILLLTRWKHSARFAGGEAARKLKRCFPAEFVHVSLTDEQPVQGSYGVPIPFLHWRLHSLGTRFLLAWSLRKRLAQRIAATAPVSDVDLIWIASDLEAVPVGLTLARLLKRPAHVTVYDAFDCSRFMGIRPWIWPLYRASLTALGRRAHSFDAVTSELVCHTRRTISTFQQMPAVVFPVCLEEGSLRSTSFPDKTDIPTVAICGELRVSWPQWLRAVSRMIAASSGTIRLRVWGGSHRFLENLPSEIDVRFMPYCQTESTLLDSMTAAGVHACYFGLWRGAEHALFAQTSLSSKLTTYLGAGIPLIVDAPPDSPGAKLAGRFGAGVDIEDAEGLARLFTERAFWEEKAQAARQTASTDLSMDKRMPDLVELIAATIARSKELSR